MVTKLRGLIKIVGFFPEDLRQADLSKLALRVVTARVLVVLGGYFTFQIETSRYNAKRASHEVMSQSRGNVTDRKS